MTDTLTLDRVMELARAHDGLRVSLYMPTHRFGPGSQETDTTRLKNHLRAAEELLLGAGMRAPDAERMLAPARALLDDRPFWLRSRDGLALFAGPDDFHVFQLPDPVSDLVSVDERYRLKPLIAQLGSDRKFWLLAVSQKRVRLYRGTRDRFEEVPAEGIPASLAEALRWDDFEKSSLQFHTGTPGTGGGRRPAVFHGTGETDPKDEIVRYFRGIDRGVRDLLKDSTAPLVLAGVDYLIPLYREVNTYPHLVDEAIVGSPDGLAEAALHERAWAIVSRLIEAERAEAAARIEEAWSSPRTTPDPLDIVPAAANGRVDLLLIAPEAQWWGSYESDTERVTVRPHPGEGDQDLLELATLHTLLNGGEVYAMPAEKMPRGEDAVALLRY